MTKIFTVILLTIFGWAVFISAARAVDVPKYISFQGQLANSAGTALTGTYSMVFRIYSAETGGALLWSETQSVSVATGFFAVSLGSQTALNLDFTDRYWVSLEVSSDGEMSPRQPLNSVPTAYRADVAYGTYTTTTAPTGATGTLYYDTDDGNLYVYDHINQGWVDLTVTTSAPTDAQYITVATTTGLSNELAISSLTSNLSIQGDNTAARTITLGRRSLFNDVLVVETSNLRVSSGGTVTSTGNIIAPAFLLQDTASDNTLQLTFTENPSTNRILNLVVGDGNRNLRLNEDFVIGDGSSGMLTFSASTTLTVSATSTINQDLSTTASPSFAGGTLDSVRIGVTTANEIDTSSGNLVIDSTGGTVEIDDALYVTGTTTLASTLLATTGTFSNGLVVDTNTLFVNYNNNRVGIGTTGADRALEINDSSGGALRLTYNDSDGSATNYADFTIASDGELTIATNGTDEDIKIQTTGFQDALVIDDSAANIGIATTTPWGKLSITNSSSAPSLVVATSTRGASLIVDSSSRVGINTASPSAQLHVKKDQNTGTELILENATTGNQAYAAMAVHVDGAISYFGVNSTAVDSSVNPGSGRAYVYNSGTGVAMRAAGSSSDFRIYTGGDNPTSNLRMVVASGGNVGVASTTPWGKLSVASDGSAPKFVVASSTQISFMVDNAGLIGVGTESPAARLQIADDQGVAQRGLIVSQHNGNIHAPLFNFRKSRGSGVSPSAIQSGDYVGLLGTAPYDGSGYDNAGAIAFVADGTVSDGVTPVRIDFITTETQTGGSSGYGTERLTIKSDGRIGVASTTPWGRFSVTSDAATPKFLVASSTQTSFLVDSQGRTGIGVANPFAALSVSSTAGVTPFAVGTSTTRLVVTENGNVGIGTASPVSGYPLTINKDSEGNLLITTVNGSGRHVLSSDSSSNALIRTLSNVDLRLGVNEDALVVKDGGKVGVGTTTPFASFSVSTTPSVPGFIVATPTTTLMLVQGNGKVGIGTSAPTSTLEVDYGVNPTGSVDVLTIGTAVGSGIDEEFRLLWQSAGYPLARIGSGFLGGLDGSSLTFATRRTTGVTEAMRIDNNGRLGVGTTTPWGALSVQTNATAPKFIVASSTRISFIIDNAGGVGIGGVTTTSSTLDVAGDVQISRAIRDAQGWIKSQGKTYRDTIGNGGGFGTSFNPGRAFRSASAWTAYDPGANGVGTDPDGFAGAVFDGRYVYFVAYYDGAYHGQFIRYDTTAPYSAASSWTAYDPGANGVGSDPDGYVGGVFDGRYIYFSPVNNGTEAHGEVLRYDTTAPFNTTVGWTAYDPGASGVGTDPDGYEGALFDGRYVIFIPYHNGAYHGEFLRYDTTGIFNTTGSWSAYDPGTNGVGSDPDGYIGGAFDGRYMYFFPSHNGTDNHGEFLRYDTTATFNTTGSWTAYDPGANGVGSDPDGFSSGVFDGRYIYVTPYFNGSAYTGEFIRYDTAASFNTAGSWVTYDPGANGVGTDPDGYWGAVFDGRYVIFVPTYNGTDFHGEFLRLDTADTFTTTSAWSAYDPGANSVGADADGYIGGVFDGRYFYFAAYHNGTDYHGEFLRFDAGAPEPQYSIGQVARSRSLFIDSKNNIGMGSTTPWGFLSLLSDGNNPRLVVASSTQVNLIVDNMGRLGVNTSTPKADIQIKDTMTLFQTGTGAASTPYIGRNVYYDGSAFRRTVADNDAPLLAFSNDGNFIFYTESDAGTTEESAITYATRFKVGGDGISYSQGGLEIGAESTNNLIDDASNGAGTATLYIGNASINVTASDERLKENITLSAINAIDVVKKFTIKDFDWKAGNKWATRGRATGLIAQEVYEYLPQVVDKPENPDNVWSVEYHHVVPYLIKAIQEQQNEIEQLSAINLLQGASNDSFDASVIRVLAVPSDRTVLIQGKVLYGEDTVGRARILADDTSVRVNFTTPYESVPVVVASLATALSESIPYAVTHEHVGGFTIEIHRGLAQDIEFSWHAFGQEGAILTVSNGTRQLLDGEVPLAPVVEAPASAETPPLEEPRPSVPRPVPTPTPTPPPPADLPPTEAIIPVPPQDVAISPPPEVAPEEGSSIVSNPPSTPTPESTSPAPPPIETADTSAGRPEAEGVSAP